NEKVRGMWKQLAPVNLTLAHAEQALTDTTGLPNRPWYRHLVYAPGYYTGYGVKTFPGIREAVEDKPDVAIAQREAGRVVNALDRYTAAINSAASGLEQAFAVKAVPGNG